MVSGMLSFRAGWGLRGRAKRLGIESSVTALLFGVLAEHTGSIQNRTPKEKRVCILESKGRLLNAFM